MGWMSGHSDSASRHFQILYEGSSCTPASLAPYQSHCFRLQGQQRFGQLLTHNMCVAQNHLRKTRLDVGSVANAGHVGQGTPCTLSLLLQGVLSGHDIAFEVWPRQRYASFVHVDKDSLLAHRNSASKPRNPLQKLHNGVSKREPLGGWVFEPPVSTLPLTFPFWALFLVPV